MPIEVGLTNEITHVVRDEDTATVYGSGLAPVLSTPYLIALMEKTAETSLRPHHETGESSVGVRVDVRHLAATPVGMEVRVRSEVIEVSLPRVRFHIEAWDDVDKIGEGEHERYVIDYARFMARMEKKQAKVS